MGNRHGHKKDVLQKEVGIGGEEKPSLVEPNNGKVTKLEDQEDSDEISVSGSEDSSETSQTNPDLPLFIIQDEVWGILHPQKKIKLSGPGTKLIKDVKTGDFEPVRKALEDHKNLDLECTDETGQAAIHYAASRGHVKILRLLVKNGAKLDFPDKLKGKTALHHAVNRDQVKAVEYLISARASMMVKDNEGKMPEQCCTNETMRMTLSNMRAAINAENEVP